MSQTKLLLARFIDDDGNPSELFRSAANEVMDRMVEMGSLSDTREDRARIVLAIRLIFENLKTEAAALVNT